MAKTAVALYETKNEAKLVVEELINTGFSRSNIQHKGKQDGNVVDTLTTVGLPHRIADAYQEGLRRGGDLVIVTTDEHQIDTAVDIMERHGSINVQERAALWRQDGWRESATDSQTQTQTRNARGDTTIPVVEEDLRVGKRQVEHGAVRVNTHIVEEPVEETVNLHEEHVEVERRPVNRAATGADFDTFQEGTMEFTESSEEAVVDKHAHVAEEVVIRKEERDRKETVRDTVRRTEVDVDRVDERRRKEKQ